MIGAIIPVLMLLIPNVYAGGARMDWPDVYGEAGEEGDRAAECWVDGYDDGLDHPFDVDRHKQCQFDFGYTYADRPYYEAFLVGCESVEGNTEEICERNIE